MENVSASQQKSGLPGDLAVAISNVGWRLHTLERDEEAVQNCKTGLEMQQRVQNGKDHPAIALELQNLAACLEALDRFQEALDPYRNASEMIGRLGGGKDQLGWAQSQDYCVAACLKHFGCALESRCRFTKQN